MNPQELASKIYELETQVRKNRNRLTKQTRNELEIVLDKVVNSSRKDDNKTLDEAAKYAISALHNLDEHTNLENPLSGQTKNQIEATRKLLLQAIKSV